MHVYVNLNFITDQTIHVNLEEDIIRLMLFPKIADITF